MVIKTPGPVTVGTRPTLLSLPDQDFVPGASIDVWLTGPGTLYVGGADVTPATGRPVTDSYQMDLAAGDLLYGVVADGELTVGRLQTGV